MVRNVWSVAAVSLAVLGCGSSDDSSSNGGGQISGSTVQKLEGIYHLETRTQNMTRCDAGASTFDQTKEKLFVLVGANVLGQETLALVSCADSSACKALVDKIRNFGAYAPEYSFMLSSEESATTLHGFEAWTGFLENGTCTKREYEDDTLTVGTGTVELTSKTTKLADKAPDDGKCWARPAEQSAEASKLPCTSGETLSGEFAEPL